MLRAAVAIALLHSTVAIRGWPRLAGASSLTPVSSLNVTKYFGRWYQTYADGFVDLTFEANNYCVAADYGLNSNGTISVHNRARIGSPSGPASDILGYAVPSSTVGELTVYLQGVPVGAPYWVFALGPDTYGAHGLYQWALVSDPFLLSLFVLARDVDDFYANYNAEVLQILNATGFTGLLNSPIQTVQQNCTY